MSVRRESRTWLFLLGLSLGLLSAGCSMMGRSSLATDTGPKSPWSVAPEQWAHVGEQVNFSCVILGGHADYAVLEVKPLEIAKVSLEAEPRKFYFEKLTFQQPTPPEQPLLIRVTAYRQRNQRDHMDLDGQLLSRESPYDVPDQKVCTSQVKLHIYQASLVVEVPADPAGYNWQTAKLLLHAGTDPVEIREQRAYRKGFTVVGPTAAGTYLVKYEPTAGQVRRSNVTPVTFSVQNQAGQEHRQEILLPTP